MSCSPRRDLYYTSAPKHQMPHFQSLTRTFLERRCALLNFHRPNSHSGVGFKALSHTVHSSLQVETQQLSCTMSKQRFTFVFRYFSQMHWAYFYLLLWSLAIVV